MFGLSSTIRMPAIAPEPIRCLFHLAYSKPCRLILRLFSAVAEFANPLFQNHLVARLDPRKHNSNVTRSRRVGDLSHSGERPAFGRDFDSQLGSSRERFTSGHTASIQTQVRGPALKLKLRLQVCQFHMGNKSIAASPWTFGMNLHRTLNFVSHTFIVRNDSRNNIVISQT